VRLRKRYLPLVAVLGVAVAVLPALAASSTAKLEVNENCVQPNWPCWAAPGSSQPAFKTTVASGGTVMFVDHGKEANIAWTGTAPTCEPSVPVAPAVPKTGWEGKCTFATPGTYKFESSTLFKDFYNDYTKYEIVVAGTPTDATTSASGETQTEAMLNGSIDPEGSIVEYHFEYEGPGVTGKQSTPTATLSAADFTSHSVSTQATGLQPGMTYHFLLVASYGGKTVAGATTQTFTTQAAKEPTKEPPAKEPPAKEPTPTPTPTPIPGPISPEPEIVPLVSPLVEGSLKLTAPRHGSSVRGSVQISKAGVGSRLEVDLLVKSASLAKVKRSMQVRVGRLVRSSLYAGSVSFVVPLTARGKAALRRQRRLALTVQIVLTPLSGAPVTVTKSVVLHA